MRDLYLNEMYLHMDINLDGKVEIQEFVHFHAQTNDYQEWLDEPNKEKLEQGNLNKMVALFDKLDADNNKSLSMEEAREWIDKELVHQSVLEIKFNSLMREVDKNKDNFISRIGTKPTQITENMRRHGIFGATCLRRICLKLYIVISIFKNFSMQKDLFCFMI